MSSAHLAQLLFVHDSILSNDGTSSKPGAIHVKQGLTSRIVFHEQQISHFLNN
jgi:hypothetical protein